MAPLFGILSTMIVTGRMSFFSDALGHSAFTGIAIGIICGVAAAHLGGRLDFSRGVCPAVFLCAEAAHNQAADTLIGVFSSLPPLRWAFSLPRVGGGSFTRIQ